jgi:arylsulfatase A-like enzyme
LLASTVVAVFSDHGEEFLDHAREEAARKLDPRGTYGMGHGHTLYQEQLHVPLALWHPALAPGERPFPASLVDIAPTLLGWLGIAPGWRFAGIDLGPALGGAPFDPELALFSSSVAFGPEREAVVRGTHKRISDGGSGAGALSFDLARDRGERVPISDPALASLDALLAAYRGARGPGAEPVRPTPKELEELQALGYLGETRVE